MKQTLFIFLMICPLWACSSCQDDEDKLPGSKPEILLGTWENLRDVGFILANYIHETYEFTPSGGSIKQMKYFPDEDRYEDYHTSYFTDWSYDGNRIYFIYKKGGYTNPWSRSVKELTSDYFIFDSGGSGSVYTKVK
jgi:hypothetical protein